MTDLATLVGALKGELAVPGTFDVVFPDTSDDDLVEALRNGFAEGQLQGFFSAQTLTGNVVDPTMSAAGGMLVVLITGQRIIRAQLRNMNMTESSRYKAGPVEVETDLGRSATVLKGELDYLSLRIADLIKTARGATTVYQLDAYPGRVMFDRVGTFFSYEVA